MRTQAIKDLVEEALRSLPVPLTEDVIDDVFAALEARPAWRQRYELAVETLGKTVTNNWAGFWIASAVGKTGKRQVPARKSSLIASYSILDADMIPPPKRMTAEEARHSMYHYYQANKAALPASVKDYRDDIIKLILAGRTAEEAFVEATASLE